MVAKCGPNEQWHRSGLGSLLQILHPRWDPTITPPATPRPEKARLYFSIRVLQAVGLKISLKSAYFLWSRPKRKGFYLCNSQSGSGTNHINISWEPWKMQIFSLPPRPAASETLGGIGRRSNLSSHSSVGDAYSQWVWGSLRQVPPNCKGSQLYNQFSITVTKHQRSSAFMVERFILVHGFIHVHSMAHREKQKGPNILFNAPASFHQVPPPNVSSTSQQCHRLMNKSLM